MSLVHTTVHFHRGQIMHILLNNLAGYKHPAVDHRELCFAGHNFTQKADRTHPSLQIILAVCVRLLNSGSHEFVLCGPKFFIKGRSSTFFFLKYIAPRWITDYSALPFYTDNKGAVSYIALRRGRRGLECHTTLILLEQRDPLPFYAVAGGCDAILH